MTRINIPTFIVLLSMIFLSCEKEELPISPRIPGDIITNAVSMGTDYRYQMFFDLETNSMVKQSHKTEWDLGFETSETGFHIILNSAKAMFAHNTMQSDFEISPNTDDLSFTWDESSGHLDSTAIGNWTNNTHVYIIDRGYNELGVHLGFKKIVFQSVDNNGYTLQFANLDGTEENSLTILKDNDYNFTFLSFDNNGSLVSIQPPKEDWDLVFTQYTNIFYDQNPPLPYLVTGAISNRHTVEVAQVFDKDFSDISEDDIGTYAFQSNIDHIGYLWKYFDFAAGLFLVDPSMNYIIKSTEERYFKLHFIDFYDQQGNKGTPTFEIQEL